MPCGLLCNPSRSVQSLSQCMNAPFLASCGLRIQSPFQHLIPSPDKWKKVVFACGLEKCAWLVGKQRVEWHGISERIQPRIARMLSDSDRQAAARGTRGDNANPSALIRLESAPHFVESRKNLRRLATGKELFPSCFQILRLYMQRTELPEECD